MTANNRKRRLLIWLCSVVLLVAIIFAVCAVYLSDYYRADEEAIAAFAAENEVDQYYDDGMIVFEPETATSGFIFYPGGKVEYTAYAPLMEACASKGILCVLVEMPFNLAVLNINAVDGVQERYPWIEDWYIGGHSLGGSMAAAYLEKNINEYEGLVLLGSYSTADISQADIEVLSVYGSEDNVMNREKYENNRANLPVSFTELVIDGGCHAYFGMYGSQDGDGVPVVTNAEQIEITADAIDLLINE